MSDSLPSRAIVKPENAPMRAIPLLSRVPTRQLGIGVSLRITSRKLRKHRQLGPGGSFPVPLPSGTTGTRTDANPGLNRVTTATSGESSFFLFHLFHFAPNPMILHTQNWNKLERSTCSTSGSPHTITAPGAPGGLRQLEGSSLRGGLAGEPAASGEFFRLIGLPFD